MHLSKVTNHKIAFRKTLPVSLIKLYSQSKYYLKTVKAFSLYEISVPYSTEDA